MKDFPNALNSILVEVYHNILCAEERFLQSHHKLSLTIREMHLIECVGMGGETGQTISEIAEYLKVARPSVTVAVNKLEKKGYLERVGSERDKRLVHVVLTKNGRRVDAYHRRYHMSMVSEIEREFDERDQEYLITLINQLNEFFKK